MSETHLMASAQSLRMGIPGWAERYLSHDPRLLSRDGPRLKATSHLSCWGSGWRIVYL
jgi:hypothetical protein